MQLFREKIASEPRFETQVSNHRVVVACSTAHKNKELSIHSRVEIYQHSPMKDTVAFIDACHASWKKLIENSKENERHYGYSLPKPWD